MLSPYSSMVWAVWIMRSRIASAIVGSPTISYQLEEGYCEVMMMDFLSCLSSIISSSMGRALASRGTRQRSSRMSSWQRSIFLSSVSSVPLILATFNAPSSLGGIGIECPVPPFACLMSKGAGQIAFPCTGRAGDEKVLSLMHEIKGREAFHLVAVQPTVCGIVDLLEIGLVSECGIPGKPRYGDLCPVVPFACEER